MVGREVNLHADKSSQKPGEPILQIEELRVRDETGHEKVRGLSLEVHAGEILGIAGVDGNGQSELAEAVMHLREITRRARASEWRRRDQAERRSTSHDGHFLRSSRSAPCRLRHGDVRCRQCDPWFAKKNTHADCFAGFARTRESALGLVARFGIRTAGIDFAAGKLSGGNLQKLILAREIMRGSAALIVEHPTRGLGCWRRRSGGVGRIAASAARRQSDPVDFRGTRRVVEPRGQNCRNVRWTRHGHCGCGGRLGGRGLD